MSNNSVLAQSATKLTVNVTDESWWSALPVFLAKTAGTGYGSDINTMKLEKVNLNKTSLISLARNNYRACFAAVFSKPDEGGEKAWKVPTDIYDRIVAEVNTFVESQVARLNSGKWDIMSYNRGFAWSNKHSAYTERATVASELLIDIDRQHTAAVIDKGIATRKLADLERQKIASDDIRIVNAKKRLTNIEQRIAAIEGNEEYIGLVKSGKARTTKE